MTLPTITHIRTWNTARRTAKLLRDVASKYIGLRVIEVLPNGSEWTGVITKMEWDASICALDENGGYCEGAWTVYVRYDDNDGKYGSWTSCEVLKITGVKQP